MNPTSACPRINPRMEKTEIPDHMAPEKPADLELDRFQNRIYLFLALRGLFWIRQYSASNNNLSNLERYLINLQCYLDAC